MLPCFILLSSLHVDISNTTNPATLQHLCRTLTVTHLPFTPHRFAAVHAPPPPPSHLTTAHSTKTFRSCHVLSLQAGPPCAHFISLLNPFCFLLAGCHDNSVAFSSQCFHHILPFFQSPCTRYLRYLDLGCCSGLSLGCDGVRCLAPCLPRMHMLQQLGLKKNGMGDAGVEALCLALHTNTQLVSLNLEQNGIGNQGCKTLAVAITPLLMLQRLFLCGNNIAARGVRELAPAVVSLTGSNLHSSSCRESSSGGGSFEISLDEEMMSILPLASTRWNNRGKLQEWRSFVHGAQRSSSSRSSSSRCFSFLTAAAADAASQIL
jgi:hypothetical protein